MNNAYRLSDFIVPPGQVPGWPVKACAGLLCVGLLAVALPLGLLALALLIYIWLILRVTVRPNQISGQMPGQISGTAVFADAVYAPVDGRVVHIDSDKQGRQQVFLMPDILDSHLHYAPVSGQTEDITWIDGSFGFSALDMPPDDQRVRRELTFSTAAGDQVMLTQFGGRQCRLIQCFLREGRKVDTTDCIGLSVFSGVVAVSFASPHDVSVFAGQRCLAAQTVLGRLR